MSISINPRMLLRNTILIKWIVALLVPLIVFTFVWSGDKIVNNVLLDLLSLGKASASLSELIEAAIFVVIFYSTILVLVGYLVAADSGNRGMLDLWLDILVFTVVPIILVVLINDLIIGLAASSVVWLLYVYGRGRVRKAMHYMASPPLENLDVLDTERRDTLLSRAIAGGFWFAVALALVWLIFDLIFFLAGTLGPPVPLLTWAAIRTVLLPIAGYYLGRLGGMVALRRTLRAKSNGNGNGEGSMNGNQSNGVSKRRQLASLSTTRAREEAKDLVPNDLPLRSTGAQRFFLLLVVAFVLFYPVLDPYLFGSGTAARLGNYGDAGRYVILALGLNIVVGFAGLLDLGYVAFFVIGAYTWSLFGANQFTQLTHIMVNPQIWPWFFWPMLIVTALVAAFWGVLLGIPTLRLRGDYLAIVTLGFGEIVPVVFRNGGGPNGSPGITGGPNGIDGVFSPAFPSVAIQNQCAGPHIGSLCFGTIDWTSSTPLPYYYLILALIAIVIFANIRLRDSRLGRAWIAIREDEIAAASSGINLVRTKLFAFGAGAFFSGIAGAYYSAKLSTIAPENFSFNDSIIFLAMVVIGGIGSIPGVIVGALAIYAINQLILAPLDQIGTDPHSVFYSTYQQLTTVFPNFSFNNIRNLLFGIILIVIMIFRPEGLIPSARRKRELHQAADEEAAVTVDPLDVQPGAPGFESEVRVE